ncbi:beta-1,3-glucan-binding protein-like [Chrysoperla carnea]|uniref:beta-1,3-glucan-binding protein-like n=1 Tax=Chrysoperla carnea TaxID=189513 RepID=UPI001D0722EF|nr:beta-1,3-glucan-binding protein-like [Chrysoperla carnea]
MLKLLILFSFCLFLSFIPNGICARRDGQYEVPPALIEILKPKGFRVSIPDEEGVTLFAFHGNINEEFNGREAGQFARDITKAKNGRWTFVDKLTKFKPGDKIYYWTYVIYDDGKNKLGYANDDQEYTVTEKDIGEAISTSTSTSTTTFKPYTDIIDIRGPDDKIEPCTPSKTTVRNQKVCVGSLIFEETFDKNLDTLRWTQEIRFPDTPDYEFVVYLKDKNILNVRDSNLVIKPMLLSTKYNDEGIVDSELDLMTACTGVKGSSDCYRRANSFFILPPVASGRINTQHKFSFKYGTVEIRAKLPTGNWIYPQLLLSPEDSAYGENYDSGSMRIAFIPGNLQNRRDLQGGLVLGSNVDARTKFMKTHHGTSSWLEDYHTFTLEWYPDSIKLKVDGQEYADLRPPPRGFSELGDSFNAASNLWQSGSILAPFDKEFYLDIGVGVGGRVFTEDSARKPWEKKDPKGMLRFWEKKNTWYPSWDDNSRLQVDYIKVWAL